MLAIPILSICRGRFALEWPGLRQRRATIGAGWNLLVFLLAALCTVRRVAGCRRSRVSGPPIVVAGSSWLSGERKCKCNDCQCCYTCRHARGLHLHFALLVTLCHDAARQWPRTVWTASPRSASCLSRQKTHRRLIPVIVMSSLTGIPSGGAAESAVQSMEFASVRSSPTSSMLAGTVRGWSAYVLSVAARDTLSS